MNVAPRSPKLPEGLQFGGLAPPPKLPAKPKAPELIKKYGKFAILAIVILGVGYLYMKRKKKKTTFKLGASPPSATPAPPVPAPIPQQPPSHQTTSSNLNDDPNFTPL